MNDAKYIGLDVHQAKDCGWPPSADHPWQVSARFLKAKVMQSGAH